MSGFGGVIIKSSNSRDHDMMFIFFSSLFQQLEEKITNTCNKIKDEVPDTVDFAMTDPDKVGSSVRKILCLF